MKYLILFLFFNPFNVFFSQNFPYTFNYGIDFDEGAESAGIVESWNGGYILIGGGNVWGTDILRAMKLTHISESGDIIWKKYIGKDQEAWWLGQGGDYSSFWDFDSNYLIGGSVSDANNESDGLIYKFDQNFDTIWTLRLDRSRWDIFYAGAMTADSNYLFAGSSINQTSFSRDMWVVKVSPSGNLLWEKNYDSFKEDEAYSVLTMNDGAIFIAGASFSTSGFNTGWLIKADSLGSIIWDRNYGGSPSCGILLGKCSDGNFIMSQCEGIQYEPGHYNPVAMISKITPSGQTIWKKYFSEERQTGIAQVKEVWGHYYLVTGIKRQVVLNIVSAWAALVDSSGHLVWEYEYSLGNGRSRGYLYDGITTPDSGLFLTGSIASADSVGHNSDFWALKVGPNGCLTPTCGLSALEAATIQNDWKIYPNPAQDVLWVEVPQNRRVYSFKIIDLLGREILREDLLPQINTHQLNISTLTSGIYWLVALDAEGQLLTSEKFFRK